MVQIRGYFGVEALPALTLQQLVTLRDALRPLAANDHPQPAHRFHYRVRLDSRALIFEGEFEDANLMPSSVKAFLAAVFGIDPANVNTQIDEGPTYVVTYSVGGTARLRYVMFGYDGTWPTWATSYAAAEQYIQNHAESWGETSTEP